MWLHTELLLDSKAAMNRRLRWLRERDRLAPEPKRVRVPLRDRLPSLFPLAQIVSTAPA